MKVGEVDFRPGQLWADHLTDQLMLVVAFSRHPSGMSILLHALWSSPSGPDSYRGLRLLRWPTSSAMGDEWELVAG
jgi:hypothetical protein